MKNLCKLIFMLVLVLSFAVSAFAESGAPIYSYRLDDKTFYGITHDANIGMLKMVKPDYTEEYKIQYFKDYFVVLSVSSDDEERHKSLQGEIGIKQEYGDNPRVNAVKDALERKNGFIRELANEYKPYQIKDAVIARKYVDKFISENYPQLGENRFVEVIDSYRHEYFGALKTYVIEFRIIEGNISKLQQTFHINEAAEIFTDVTDEQGHTSFQKVN